MEAFMKNVSPTPNSRRPSTNIHRKQCAFLPTSAGISEYEFGQKQDTKVVDNLDNLPPLVASAFHYIRRQSLSDDDRYTLLQCNYYKDASVGISPHSDDEKCIDLTYPILSLSFYADKNHTRSFSIYTMDKTKLLDIPLGHGDLCTMSGGMQREFLHGIEKERANKCASRINFTFRVVKTD